MYNVLFLFSSTGALSWFCFLYATKFQDVLYIYMNVS